MNRRKLIVPFSSRFDTKIMRKKDQIRPNMTSKRGGIEKYPKKDPIKEEEEPVENEQPIKKEELVGYEEDLIKDEEQTEEPMEDEPLTSSIWRVWIPM